MCLDVNARPPPPVLSLMLGSRVFTIIVSAQNQPQKRSAVTDLGDLQNHKPLGGTQMKAFDAGVMFDNPADAAEGAAALQAFGYELTLNPDLKDEYEGKVLTPSVFDVIRGMTELTEDEIEGELEEIVAPFGGQSGRDRLLVAGQVLFVRSAPRRNRSYKSLGARGGAIARTDLACGRTWRRPARA
jgi:hypothetical protein